VNNKYTEVIKC